MGAAFVIGDGVDFVDDDGADVAEVLAGLACGEEDVEGFGGGDENVGRALEHLGALAGEGVSGADAGADLGAEIAAGGGELLDFSEGAVEVLLDVVGEGLEGGDVEDLRLGGEGAGDGLAEEGVDADEEGGEGLAGAGGRGDESGVAAEDAGPAVFLGLGGGAELRGEPLLHDGVCPGQGNWTRDGLADGCHA